MVEADSLSEPNPYDEGIRDWVKIIDTILEICTEGALRTHIMYRCNLNTIQTRKYLDLLEDRELLELEGNEARRGTIYKTTDKGMEYVRAFRQLEETLR